MVRLADLPAVERDHLLALPCPEYDDVPWTVPPPLAEARLALISTAAVHLRGDDPLGLFAADYRVIPGDVDPADLVMSHVSVNFDRTGFAQDANVVFPLERARELAAEGAIGSLARYHYAYSGAGLTPEHFERAGGELARLLRADAVDAAALFPV